MNDFDCYLANFWRAVAADPEAVAFHADHPVNEADLHARHRWLVGVERPRPLVPDLFVGAADAYLAGFLGSHPTYASAFRERMRRDPDHYDARIAGWWVWGICCWIGAGWCGDYGETVGGDRKEVRPMVGGLEGQIGRGVNAASGGLSQQLPDISGDSGASGRGVHAMAGGLSQKLPDISGHAGGSGRGIHQSSGGKALTEKVPQLTKPVGAGGINASVPEKRPILAAPENESGTRRHHGIGVHSQGPSDSHRPQLADAFSRGRGVHGNDSAGTCSQRRAWLADWFQRIADRFRTVRVCCGDWRRVCDSPSVTTRLGMTGLFLDPPYRHHTIDGKESRSADLYSNDRAQDVNALVDDVIAYCLERGPDPLMRIAVCGYEGEGYEALEAAGWSVVAWKASGGYGNRKAGENVNAGRERIWFSPACIDPSKKNPTLFDL